MRDYLSVSNLWYASIIGVVISLMSLMRMMQGGINVFIGMPAMFFAMTLTGGMVTAWGHKAGMNGIFPDKRTVTGGLVLAICAACIFAVLSYFLIDPVARHIMRVSGNSKLLSIMAPRSVSGCVGLVLWVSGFEVMFFEAGAMSFFARLTGSKGIAVLGAVCFRMYVVFERLSNIGVHDEIAFFLVNAAAGTAIGCLLFARAGLPATALFSAVTSLRYFFLL